MKRLMHIFLAGLAAAGLASCEKQDLKPTSEKDVYSIVIEEELQTKATVMTGDKKTFHAYLTKNGTPISCSNWGWSLGALLRNDGSGTSTYKGVTAAYVNTTAISTGTAKITATATDYSVSSNISMSIKGISAFEFTVASTSLTAGKSTTYKVRVKYTGDYSYTDVTSSATVSSSNSSMLSVSGGNVQSNKKIGCLGTFTLTASYGGQSATKDITVNTDYKSDDITLSWTSDVGRSGSASSGTLSGYVKRNDASRVTVSFSGNLKTSNSDTYAVSNGFIEFYVKDVGSSNYLKASTSQTYWAEEGDKEDYELRYLGKAVKTWTINWNPY